tara:strand:- start:679 stop:894 length:216 start_codon:yes stop_codon:yes gene_type:complete
MSSIIKQSEIKDSIIMEWKIIYMMLEQKSIKEMKRDDCKYNKNRKEYKNNKQKIKYNRNRNKFSMKDTKQR